MYSEDLGDGDFMVSFSDEESPRSLEEFQLRLDGASEHGGDFIVWVLGEQDIEPEVLQWLRDQPTGWFERQGVYDSDEFLSDDYRF